MGAYVIVVNADKVAVTGKKETDKLYYRHATGRPGSMKIETLRDLRKVRGGVAGPAPRARLALWLGALRCGLRGAAARRQSCRCSWAASWAAAQQVQAGRAGGRPGWRGAGWAAQRAGERRYGSSRRVRPQAGCAGGWAYKRVRCGTCRACSQRSAGCPAPPAAHPRAHCGEGSEGDAAEGPPGEPPLHAPQGAGARWSLCARGFATWVLSVAA